MDTKKISPVTLGISLGILVATYYPILMAMMTVLPYYTSLGLALLIQIISILLVVFINEKSLVPIGLGKNTWAKGIKKGVIWSLGFAFTALTAALVLSLFSIDFLGLVHVRLPNPARDRIMFFLVGGLVAPVAEEIFFRGVLFGYLRKYGFFVALIMTTVIFVAVHIPSGIPVTQVVGGLVFALSYEVEKSLWTPIIIHSSGNIALFACSMI